MTNINWAPIIGGLLVLTGVVGFGFHYMAAADATMILALGLGLLGIHDSNVKLGNKLGNK